MDAFVGIVTKINDLVWSTPLVALCLIAGIYFTIRFRGGSSGCLKTWYG